MFVMPTSAKGATRCYALADIPMQLYRCFLANKLMHTINFIFPITYALSGIAGTSDWCFAPYY